MEKINYQIILDKTLEQIKNNNKNNDKKTRLLLHSCCGPCSTYVIEYLVLYFDITVFYYNPNIFPRKEYEKRREEQIRYIKELNICDIYENKIEYTDIGYDDESFKKILKGKENQREGSQRCFECFELRLEKTAQQAQKQEFDYFTTTLTVSPYKNAQKLNQIGKELEEKYNVKYLFSDFKKKEGYKKSIVISKEHDLYRQHYCGCESSLKQSLEMQKQV